MGRNTPRRLRASRSGGRWTGLSGLLRRTRVPGFRGGRRAERRGSTCRAAVRRSAGGGAPGSGRKRQIRRGERQYVLGAVEIDLDLDELVSVGRRIADSAHAPDRSFGELRGPRNPDLDDLAGIQRRPQRVDVDGDRAWSGASARRHVLILPPSNDSGRRMNRAPRQRFGRSHRKTAHPACALASSAEYSASNSSSRPFRGNMIHTRAAPASTTKSPTR